MAFRHAPSAVSAQTGAVLVEASVCLGAFLFTLLLAFDLLRVGYLSLTMQHAVQMTTSWAALGTTVGGEDRVVTIKKELIRRAARLGVALDSNRIWVCADPRPRFCLDQNAGAERQAFQITVQLPVRVSLLHRNVVLEFDGMARNEPAS